MSRNPEPEYPEHANPWTTVDSRQVYENPWISVREDQVLRPDGKRGIYGVVHFKNRAIGVLPVDAEGNVYLVGQHRLGMESTGSQMTFVGECLLGYGRLVDPDEARRALEAVTAAEVQAAARAMFAGPPPALALVGPVEAGEAELRGWMGR